MTEQEKKEFANTIIEAVDKKIDQKFSENNNYLVGLMDKRFIENNDNLINHMEKRFKENNQVLLEAVNGVVNTKMDEYIVRQEQFESNVIGLLKDLKTGMIETQKISERVDTHEGIIKNNVLPRIEVLEQAMK